MGRAGGEFGDLVEVVGEEGVLLRREVGSIQGDVIMPGEIRPGWEEPTLEVIQA